MYISGPSIMLSILDLNSHLLCSLPLLESLKYFLTRGQQKQENNKKGALPLTWVFQSVPSPNVFRLWALVILIGGERGQDLQEDQKCQIKMCQN